MKETTNIYLIGLGGIGGAYASIAKDNGFDVKVICNQQRKKRYTRDGFVINGKAYQFEYFTKPVEEVDLLLVVVKANQLQEAIVEIKPFITKNTIILSLLNGISSERLIKEKIDQGIILPAFTVKTDGQRVRNEISFTPGGRIVFGHQDKRDKAFADQAANLLSMGHMPFEQVDNIEYQQWWKLMANIGINQTQALLQVPYSFFKKEHARNISRLAMEEAMSIAQALKINLKEENIEEILDLVANFTPENKTSMLQDIEAKRLTEVDIFAGEIIRLGQQLGIATPINQLIYHFVRHLEEQW